MCAVRRAAAIATHAHGAGSAGKHALDGEFGPVAELVTIFHEESLPAVIVLEQELCGARYVHDAEYIYGLWNIEQANLPTGLEGYCYVKIPSWSPVPWLINWQGFLGL